jgi:zinc protease
VSLAVRIRRPSPFHRPRRCFTVAPPTRARTDVHAREPSLMTSVFRAATAALAVLFLAPALARAEALAVRAPAGPAGWPQATSDIRPDPEVRFGRLANGMRYMIMRNTTPAHETSIRLRIGSGSMMEKDGDEGLAHFVEHMAFKGSNHVPAGEMVKLLERRGLAFGADTNAFTTYTQTFYQLDLPESDDGSIDLGLMLMRETASELTFDPKTMDAERGVVAAEERDRDSPEYEASQKSTAFLMKGQLVNERSPIGKLEVIRTVPASRLRAFYDANYRPERAALIVVGDIDVDALEARIKARFSDWAPKGPAPAEPDYGAVQPRGSEADVIVQPGLPASLAVAWTGPHDPAPDTRAKEQRAIVEHLGLAIINHRLSRLALGDQPPFLSASTSRADELRSMQITTLAVTPRNDDWRGALAAADGVRREAATFGVQPAELARVVTDMRERYHSAVVGKSTRPTPAIAADMLETLDEDEVYCGPLENDQIFEEAVKGLTPEKVDAALRGLFQGQGPLLAMITPTPLPGGGAALTSGFRMAEAQPIKPGQVFADQRWPYTHFGAPGVVVRREAIPDLGVAFVYFANGVTLAFKQTHFGKDQVLVAFDLPGGRLTLPADRPAPLWEVGALGVGGMRQISLEDTEQVLAGRSIGFNAQMEDDDFLLGAHTSGTDLDTQMQILTAFLSDPGWRRSGLEQLRSASLLQYDQIDATPDGALDRRLDQLLHGGDARWASTTRAQLLTDGLPEAHALWDGPLQGPVNVAMVGDVTLDQAIAAVARTVGALPPRGPAAPVRPQATRVQFPAPTTTPITITHKGRADQAIAYIAWPGQDFFSNPQEARAISLAAQVMQDRLLQKVRTEQGASYSPSANANPSDIFPGYGAIFATVETSPGRLDGFFKAVSEIAADLRTHPISTDELERARRPRVEQVEKAQQTNTYWIKGLIGAVEDRRRIEITRETIPGYEALTPEDVQAAVRKYLRDERAFKVVVVPESRLASSAAPSALKD